MAITPKQLEIEASYIQDVYMSLEDEIIKLIVQRLNKPTNTPLTKDTVFEWRLEKLAELNMMNDDTIRQLAEQTSEYSHKQLKKIIVDMGHEVLSDVDKELGKYVQGDMPPRNNLEDTLESFYNQQWREFDNHVNQSLINTNYPGNAVSKAYTQVLNDAVGRIVTGLETPERAFKHSVYDWVNRGVMTSFVDKSGREWSLERYVRMVLQTTTHRTYNDLRLKRGIELGIVTALMSSHFAAREACAPIQGGWVLLVPIEQAPKHLRHLPSIYNYGYGDPGGTQGINCKHRLYIQVYDPDLDITMKQYEPEEAIKNAEMVSKQRRMEVAIRHVKRQLYTAEQMGDEEDVNHFKHLVRRRQASLRLFIDDNEQLRRDYSREFVAKN